MKDEASRTVSQVYTIFFLAEILLEDLHRSSELLFDHKSHFTLTYIFIFSNLFFRKSSFL